MKAKKHISYLNEWIDCLESYMQFNDIVHQNCHLWYIPEQFQRQMNTLCVRRKEHYKPILEHLIKELEQTITPCKYCGSKPKIIKRDDICYICCSNCTNYAPYQFLGTTINEATERWEKEQKRKGK